MVEELCAEWAEIVGFLMSLSAAMKSGVDPLYCTESGLRRRMDRAWVMASAIFLAQPCNKRDTLSFFKKCFAVLV